MAAELNFWGEVPNVYVQKKHLIPKAHNEAAHVILRRLQGYSAKGRLDLILNSGIRKQTATQALSHLVRLGIVTRNGKGTKGSPYLYEFR